MTGISSSLVAYICLHFMLSEKENEYEKTKMKNDSVDLMELITTVICVGRNM